MAIEEPAFKSILHEGAFEVRDYASLVVAEVTVSGDQKEAASRGFRLLAGYIFGGNKRRQSIAMTAPVAQAPVGVFLAPGIASLPNRMSPNCLGEPTLKVSPANSWISASSRAMP